MPATPADIAAVSREAIIVSATDAAIDARYANARDGSAAPAIGYCDAATDAQTLLAGRGSLMGTERRRFAVPVFDVIWPNLADGIPQPRVVDAEHAADLASLTARFEVDLERESSTFETFG